MLFESRPIKYIPGRINKVLKKYSVITSKENETKQTQRWLTREIKGELKVTMKQAEQVPSQIDTHFKMTDLLFSFVFRGSTAGRE